MADEKSQRIDLKSNWKQSLRRWALGTLTPRQWVANVWREINEDDIFSIAARLAYYFLFALFPLLLFFVTLIGFLPIENLFDEIIAFLQKILPEEALILVQGNIQAIVREQRGGLLSFGLIMTLWAASRGVASISSALNLAYGVKERRPWWKVQGLALFLTLSLSLFVIAAAILMVFGGEIGGWLAHGVGLGFLFELLWNPARLILSALIMVGVLAIVYYYCPDVEQEWKWVTPGSVVAALGWIAASLAFSYYVERFGDYNKTYGTIGAVIILLTWMYITGFMILLGGEINSVVERSLPEGKRAGEKRIAEKDPSRLPGHLLLKTRAKVHVQGRLRRFLFSPWSIAGLLTTVSAALFYAIKHLRSRSSET